MIYILYRKKKLDNVIEYVVKALDVYGKNIINKVKLAVLLNVIRTYILSSVKNSIVKSLIELFWPEVDLLKIAGKVTVTNKIEDVINSVPEVVISKTVDKVLNNTRYTISDFNTMTNLKITEKDRGYLEAYLEGQLNKLEEARVGIKAGIKW